MAGVLFVVSLPTASFERSSRPVSDANQEKSSVSEITDGRSFPSKADSYRETNNNVGNSSKENEILTHGSKAKSKLPGSKSVSSLSEHVAHLKNSQLDYAVSSPTVQLDLAERSDDISKITQSSQSISTSDSTEVLIEEFVPEKKLNNKKENEKGAISSLSRKLVTALTPTKGLPSADGPSSLNKPDTAGTMEEILCKALEKMGVDNAVWNLEKSGKRYQVYFTVESGEPCEDCLQCLNENGFGYHANTTVSVIPCTLFYKGEDGKHDSDDMQELEPEDKDPDVCGAGLNGEGIKNGEGPKIWNWNKFVASVRARLTVAQVVESVRANAELTFDFIMLLLVAGMVAAMGLVENSSVVLVASMLISPLMGPIMAGTFGIVIQDKQLQKIGVLNEILGLASCITVGFVYGLIIGCADSHWGSEESAWPTQEMVSRGVVRSLWVGVLIAIPSGAGVALSVLGGNTSSLVGVAISASLLPPAVNAGLFWALATIKSWSSGTQSPIPQSYIYSENPSVELAMLGVVSLGLTLVNIACIFVAAVAVLKVKEVAPRANREEVKRFWRHDIKIARGYNRTMQGDTAKDLEKQLMDELAGLPQNQVKAIVEGAAQERRRFSMTRHISESGVTDGDNFKNIGFSGNQRTWTPGTNMYNIRRPLTSFYPNSLSGPSDEEVENLVYSTLTAGSRQGLFGKQSGGGNTPFRKISSTSWHGGHQIRSPTRVPSMEPHLDTIKESTSSLFHTQESNAPHPHAPTRFQVTPCVEDDSAGAKKVRKTSKAPLAKSDE